MIGGGAELLAGLVQDPVFGPLVAFGPGGVLAELIGEANFRIAPLTDVDAEELVTRQSGSPRQGLPRRTGRRRRFARRSRLPPVAPRQRPARPRRARPQPGTRAAGRLHRRRCACSCATAREPVARQELVAAAASRVVLVDLEQALLERVADEFGTCREAQLLHDVRAMRLGSADRDEELFRDLLVRMAQGE